jgi:hypothetical protein
VSAYLLVHPERFPANDDFVLGPHLPDGLAVSDFDSWYANALIAETSGGIRRVVLLDSFGREDLEEDGEFLAGVDPEGWEVAPCEPHEVGHVVRRLFRDSATKGSTGKVIVAGFARNDCVARAQKALERLGLEVELSDVATLPLSAAGAAAYLERT